MIKMEKSEKKIKKHNITRTIHLSLLVSLKYFPYSNRFFSSLHPNVGFQRKKRVIFLWKGIFGEKARKEAKSV